MKPLKSVRFLTVAAFGVLIAGAPGYAEDTKGRWQFGFGISYYTTDDFIRSNADVAISGDVIDETGIPNVRYVDERPDDNILNQPSINDDFSLDFNVSYGLTRWLALQMETSYLNSAVGSIEFYTEDSQTPISGSGTPISDLGLCGPEFSQTCFNYSATSSFETTTNAFLAVGEITEIPVRLTALVRFRPESPLDPYIGLGIGYVFTDLTTSATFDARTAETARLEVGSISKGEVTDATPPPDVRGTNFNPAPLQATVDDTFEWHAQGGVDYYINERFGFFVDAKYVWTDGAVQITTDGASQVRIAVPDQGTILLFQDGSTQSPFDFPETCGVDENGNIVADNTCTLWEDHGVARAITLDFSPGSPGYRGVLGNSSFHAACNGDNFAYDEAAGADDYRDGIGGPIDYKCQNSGLFETEEKGIVTNGLVDFDLTNEDPDLVRGEDNGVIYVLPPGTKDTGRRYADMTFYCPECDNNALTLNGNTVTSCGLTKICDGSVPHPQNPNVRINLDTEDANFNRMMDRFSLYGLDVCTDPNMAPNFPECQNRLPIESTDVQKFVWPEGCATNIPGVGSFNSPEGCPPPTRINASKTGVDDAADLYIIQGGSIRLGGFSLGLGFKLMF